MYFWAITAVRVLLGLGLAAYAVYAVLAIWAARQWSRTAPAASPNWTPAITILKPLCGVDAEAWENFASFCRVDYPPDRLQILFGALDPQDPALELARRVQTEFPHHDIQVCLPPADAVQGNNRKVCNLLSMLPHAKHDLLVLCDSDMRVRPDYLLRIAAPFETKDERAVESQSSGRDRAAVGLVTCPYRGASVKSTAAALEALSIGADFIPSALVSRAIEGVSFALGSTIAIPRAILNEIGGFEPLVDELADDYRIGNAVHSAGYRIVISDYVIEDVIGQERFSQMWSRRLRWARTVRSCRPAGYASTIITHGLPLGILFLGAAGFSGIGWGVLATICLIRAASSLTITLKYTRDPNLLRWFVLLPISDLLSVALFVASYCGRHIMWRGEKFRLLPGGKLQRVR